MSCLVWLYILLCVCISITRLPNNFFFPSSLGKNWSRAEVRGAAPLPARPGCSRASPREAPWMSAQASPAPAALNQAAPARGGERPRSGKPPACRGPGAAAAAPGAAPALGPAREAPSHRRCQPGSRRPCRTPGAAPPRPGHRAQAGGARGLGAGQGREGAPRPLPRPHSASLRARPRSPYSPFPRRPGQSRRPELRSRLLPSLLPSLRLLQRRHHLRSPAQRSAAQPSLARCYEPRRPVRRPEGATRARPPRGDPRRPVAGPGPGPGGDVRMPAGGRGASGPAAAAAAAAAWLHRPRVSGRPRSGAERS